MREIRENTLRTGSVRRRTIAAVLLLLIVLLVVLSVTVDAVLGVRLRAQIEDRLADRAAAATSLVGVVNSDDLAQRLSQQGLAVRIESASGEEVVAGPTPEQLRKELPGGLSPRPGAPRVESRSPAQDDAASSDEGLPAGAADSVAITSSLISGDDQLVTLTSTLSDGSTLVLTASAVSVGQTLAQLRWVMAAACAALLLAAAVAVVLVVRTTLRPLDRVTTVARSIAGGDRGRRLRPSNPRTEIGRVASAFDEMLDDVEGAERAALDAETRMRAFVSDAAHELRTPVAGIRAAADTLVRSDLSGSDREVLASQIAREAGRASRLIDDMLMMARLDRGLEMLPVRVDAAELVRTEMSRLRLRRPSLDVVTAVPPHAVWVDADIDRLGQVLANLIDNAARAMKGQGRVVVELTANSADVVIAVMDEGPGVAAGDRERIFDRLVRLDPARESHAGAGLGLPIARGIARALGGDVMSVPSPAGARFEVRLPRASDEPPQDGASESTQRRALSGRSAPR